MKKMINLGKALSKAEQKKITGGYAECIVCSDGRAICGSVSQCTAVPQYGELWCGTNVYRC